MSILNNQLDWKKVLVASFKGISQVVFIENTITGILFLLAITIASPLVGAIAWLSSFIAVLIGIVGKANEDIIQKGLLGFNPVLTGMALTLSLTGPYHWVIALIGAVVAAFITAAMMHLMRNTKIPVLSFPFIIVSWVTLLASYQLDFIQLSILLAPQDLTHWSLDIEGTVNWFQAILNGLGQIFFLQNPLSSVLLYIGLFFASWKFGLFALIGNVIAILTAFALGGAHELIHTGLYGFNGVLIILAVAVAFKESHNSLGYITGIFGACISVPLTATVTTWLIPYGLPVFTMPFVLCTWLLLAARNVLPRF
ncbi:urea transporter [Solibacillus sp. FSL K6-1523]|uniref:urea transporter n=1 Tax=Solibacillus sp. FSL K6-1523 TaxID=2921471 RepID=UPI0030F7A9EC